MGALDVLKYWKVRFAIALALLGILADAIAIFLFSTKPLIAVILLASSIIFILLLAWVFWSIITNPPDIENILGLLSK
jgi:membrane protein YdbS with pleckstrin-like domain